MYVTILSSRDQLQTLRDQWDEMSGGIPFRTFQWLVTWWKHYGADEVAGSRLGLFVLAVYESPRQRHLVGIAPWFVEHTWWKGRVVRFLGHGEACSEYLSLLCREGQETDVAVALVDWLTGAGAEQWDAVELADVACGDAAIAALQAQMKNRGNTVSRFAGDRCWRLTLPTTWDEYLSSLSKSHRRQVRRIERRLLDSACVCFRRVTSQDELRPAFATLVQLHRGRRDGLGQHSSFDSRQFSSLLEKVAEQLFENGMLHLNLLELDGRVVAADFNLVRDGVIYAYQGGIDTKVLDIEPGNLLTIATIRNAIQEGYTGYDLLRGDEPYKAHWRAVPREVFGLRIGRKSHVAQARNLAWLASHHARHWARRGWHTVAGWQLSAMGKWLGRHRSLGVLADTTEAKP